METSHFSGLNLVKKSNDSFIFKEKIDFSKLQLTFDSIYLVDLPNKILLFDFNLKEFNELKLDQIKNIISVSTNTNYLYCLVSNENEFNLIQISANRLIKQTRLDDLDLKSHLQIVSTDINLYLFECLNGITCKFELSNTKSKDLKQMEQEKQLNESSVCSISLNKPLIDENVKEILAGKEHCLILTSNGKVYSFGLGTKGQLGHGKIENEYEPKLIDSFKNEIIISIACGGWHSAAIDQNYNAYFWGWNSSNQLGTDETERVFVTSPNKIQIHDLITNELISFKSVR